MAVGGPETDVASLPGTAPAIDLPRAVRLLTGLAWFSWAQLWLQGSGQSAIAPVISTFALLGGVVIIGISIASWPAERWRKVDVRILTGTLVIVGLWLGVNASAHLLLVHASSIRRDRAWECMATRACGWPAGAWRSREALWPRRRARRSC